VMGPVFKTGVVEAFG